MKRRSWIIVVLVLPVLGLFLSAGWHGWRRAGASEWRIPVTGYDPRDLLAGHYARFRFAWRVEGTVPPCKGGECVFCLEDRGGEVIARVTRGDAPCANRLDPEASAIDVTWPAAGSTAAPDASGRIYISEGDADRITKMLAEDRAMLVARLGKGDQLVVERIEPAS